MQNLVENIPAATIQPDEIHLWFAFPDEIQDDALISEYQKLMTPDERVRHQRFHFAKHRHQYLIARALVRTILSGYSGIKPQYLRFTENTYGRPEIEGNEYLPPFRFNLSHTEGLIFCAVVLKHDIGVDVEDMERPEVSPAIAERFFSPREVEELNNLPERLKRNRFFDYWTLKESYIKARGMGLSIPLEQFSFHLSENELIRVSFDPPLNEEPKDWTFWLLRPTHRHKAALSIHQGSRKFYPLLIKKVIPLIKEQDLACPIVSCSQPWRP